MLRLSAAILLLGAAATGCSPTFNWREVRAEPAPLRAMLPCKPDKGSRRVPMAGREVELGGVGCDTGGATFAVLSADIGDAGRAAEVLEQWNRATLANLRAAGSRSQPFVPPGALPLPTSVRVTAQGQRADGSVVRSEAAYFARGARVYQAVVYAVEPRAEWVQPFFEGLRFE
jgi:hypothetical protein